VYGTRLLVTISLTVAITIIVISALIAVIIFYRTLSYHFVNKPKFHGFRGGKEVIALDGIFDLFQFLTGVLYLDIFQPVP
jgi:hypothetical protein